MADSETFIPALHTPSALLPIARHRDALLYTIETNPITILVGQTGSGKTTQLPQYLEQAGWCNDGKIIAVTQASPPNLFRVSKFQPYLDVDSLLQIHSHGA